MKDLLRITDLTPDDLAVLLDMSAAVKARPHQHADLLGGDTVVCYFAKPSTRTRLSFGSAITRLGGVPQVVGPTELQLGRGETIEDTAAVISRYARAFVIRTFADDDVDRSAAAATIPVVNALTDLHHPCQALADLLTIQERFGSLGGRKVAYLGDGNNVAHSLMEACALAGMDVAVATPTDFSPDPGIVAAAQTLAASSGSTVEVSHDPRGAVAGADVVYTDVWLSMGDDDSTREARREALAPFRVDSCIMAAAPAHALFMHCLPAHRGEEVAADVIDGWHSVVFDQAENRMHTAQALLVALIDGRLQGAHVPASRPEVLV